jgi:hypothetical protein
VDKFMLKFIDQFPEGIEDKSGVVVVLMIVIIHQTALDEAQYNYICVVI